jgi:hypothetical protein
MNHLFTKNNNNKKQKKQNNKKKKREFRENGKKELKYY